MRAGASSAPAGRTCDGRGGQRFGQDASRRAGRRVDVEQGGDRRREVVQRDMIRLHPRLDARPHQHQRNVRVVVVGSAVSRACRGANPERLEDDLEIAGALRDGRLKRVLADWSPTVPGLYLYYSSRRHMLPALRAFIDCLLDRDIGQES